MNPPRRHPESGVEDGLFGLANELRDSPREHLAYMHEIKRVLEQNGHVLEIVTEARVGDVVYEDAFQVIAEPFSDTRTG